MWQCRVPRGAWINYPQGPRFLIREPTEERNRLLDSLMEDEPALIRAFASEVLIDWSGVRDKSKKLIPYSPDNAVRLFMIAPELFDALYRHYCAETTFLQPDEMLA